MRWYIVIPLFFCYNFIGDCMRIRMFKEEDRKDISKFRYLGLVTGKIDFKRYTYRYVAVDNNEVVGLLYAGRSERRLCYSLGD